MRSEASFPRAVRFGVFEFDPRAGELRKQGMKLKLQGQPIEILALLLKRPGEVITREELQKKLWAAHVRTTIQSLFAVFQYYVPTMSRDDVGKFMAREQKD